MSSRLDERLEAARGVGDAAADALVAGMGRGIWAVNASLRHAHRNGERLPPLPGVVGRFFDEHTAIPRWADAARIARAQHLASRSLFHLTVALFCASLPTAYSAADGARVLVETGRMRGDSLERRVNETAQFVLDVLAVGGFGPEGSAVRSIQKVRLVHAAVRASLVGRGFEGMPINQEDQLGTLFTFSTVVLAAMRKMGVAMTRADEEDFYHLWRVAGVMLGVSEELLPAELAGAEGLSFVIFERQCRPSEHGRALMDALLSGMKAHLPRLPSAPGLLVRVLAGARVADALGVAGGDSFRDDLALLRLLPGGALSAAVCRLAPVIGRPLLSAVVAAKLGGEPACFPMPELAPDNPALLDEK